MSGIESQQEIVLRSQSTSSDSKCNFPTPSTFLCWKIRFKNQDTACSDFPSEAMLWIKEVEVVDSLDD